MKKILLLTAVLFACLSAQANLITQTEADYIVWERLIQETQPYIVYAKDGVQSKMTITSANGEVLEVNYKFWLYYIDYFNNAGQYIFVKESNGKLLEVNVTSDATPGDLNVWRIVKTMNCKELKIGEITELKWGEIACNTQYGLSLRVGEIVDWRCPIGLECFWEGYASVEFYLTTEKGQYDFIFDTHRLPIIKNDTVIEEIRYRLIDVSPYPVEGEEQEKTVKILVGSQKIPDSQWKLVRVESLSRILGETNEVTNYPQDSEPYIIHFKEDFTVAFPLYCNISQGTYLTAGNDGSISFDGFFPCTEMYCGELYDWEMLVVYNLLQSKKYAIKDNTLIIDCEEHRLYFKLCDKDNDSLIFNFHRWGSWIGLDETLKITADSTHYSISYRNLQTSELISYQIAIKTSDKQWNDLTNSFDLETFTKIQNGACSACVDGFDETFSVTKNGEVYSIYNGRKDEYYKQMQEFFDAIMEQANILKDGN